MHSLHRLLKPALFIIIASSLVLGSISCKSYKNNTEERIQKQKRHQKRNPGDCPRIDC